MPHRYPDYSQWRPSRISIRMSEFVFASRWLQAPLYLGLIVAQGYYVYRFFLEIAEIFIHPTMDQDKAVLLVLGLIDVVMISNLLIMVIVGGYETFVTRLRMDNHADCPEWLGHVNSNTMKTKLAMALIGISSIHLLKSFVNSEHHLDTNVLLWQCIVHTLFVISALGLALIGRILESGPHGGHSDGGDDLGRHHPAPTPAPAPAPHH